MALGNSRCSAGHEMAIPAVPYLFHRPVLADNTRNPKIPLTLHQAKRRDIGHAAFTCKAKTYSASRLKAKEHEAYENIRGVADVFSALDKGDIFVYVSGTVDPFEVRPEDKILRPIMADAIARGASFLYVRPTDKISERI